MWPCSTGVFLVDLVFAAVVGALSVLVNLVDLSLRKAVVAEQDVVVAVQIECRGLFHKAFQIPFEIPVLAHRDDFRNDVPPAENLESFFEGGPSRGGGVLGVERKDADAVVTVFFHPGHHVVHRGMLVPHGEFHRDVTAKRLSRLVRVHAGLQFALEGLSVQQERRPFVGPHFLVFPGATETPNGGNDAVDQDFARQPGDVNDTAVA